MFKVFSVFDSKAKFYSQPFFVRSAAEALRSWGEICNDGKSQMAKYPADFTLFHIGDWDDVTGVLTPNKAFNSFGTGLEAQRDRQPVSSGENLRSV